MPAFTHRGAWLQGHKNWVLCLAWSPDAKYLVSGSMDGQILVWQADSGKLKGTCRVSFPHRSVERASHPAWLSVVTGQME